MELQETTRHSVKVLESVKKKNAVVLFHGYGANFHDLASLSQVIFPSETVTWIFPDGFENVMGVGRSWFHFDYARDSLFEKSQNLEKFPEILEMTSKKLTKASEKLFSFYESLKSDFEKVIIGGFSQGSILTMELVSNVEKKPDGVLLLSGGLLNKNHWSEASQKHPLPFFQSHGKQDMVLPFVGAEVLEEVLLKAKWQGELYGFQGGHEIPQVVLKKMENFINRIF